MHVLYFIINTYKFPVKRKTLHHHFFSDVLFISFAPYLYPLQKGFPILPLQGFPRGGAGVTELAPFNRRKPNPLRRSIHHHHRRQPTRSVLGATVFFQ